MAAPIDITVKIDTSGLEAGIKAAEGYSKRTMPQLINTAAYWVAVNAKAGMPFVTVERIDQELSVIEHPIIGKRGNPLKGKKRFSAAPQAGGAPLAALIIQARVNPGSRYNELTGGRWSLPASPFKGVSREAGRAAMALAVDKEIKRRHRSGKFLLAGFIPIIQKLLPFTVQKFLPGGARPMEGRSAYYGAPLGTAYPAKEGFQVSAIIENEIGLEGANQESMNRALLLHGTGPLQDAVNREGQRQLQYAWKKYEEGLAGEVNPRWK